MEKRSRRRQQLNCEFGRQAGWKSEPVCGCIARSVASQAASSILSPAFHDEGELG